MNSSGKVFDRIMFILKRYATMRNYVLLCLRQLLIGIRRSSVLLAILLRTTSEKSHFILFESRTPFI